MDRVFQAAETEAYEAWLEGPEGRRYQSVSRALLDRVLDWRRGWRVLDVGCGLGVHLAHLMDRGMLVNGLEAGPVMARLAASRLGEKATIDLGDAHDLPYEDNTFDAVVLVNTLELTQRRAQVLAEAARVAASRVAVVSLNPVSPTGVFWRWPRGRHPLFKGRSLGLWSLQRLVREVLGPVPMTWSGATLMGKGHVSRWPLSGLVGVCAAVTPRFRTNPLLLDQPAEAGVRPRPVASASRVSVLHRVK